MRDLIKKKLRNFMLKTLQKKQKSIVKNVGQLIYVHYVMLIATMLMDYIFHIDIIHVETKESIWKTI